MSGRRSSSDEGRPAGTSGGTRAASIAAPRPTSPGALPSNRLSASSVCAIWRCRLAICPVAVNSSCSGLAHVEAAGDAAIAPDPREPQIVGRDVARALGDGELRSRVCTGEIDIGDVGDERG